MSFGIKYVAQEYSMNKVKQENSLKERADFLI